MLFDVATPIREIPTDREETLIVCFEGFIKNPSEGMIRTMKREEEKWIDRYPKLIDFQGLTQEELYDQTLLFRPEDLLIDISNGNLSEDEIQEDINKIFPEIFWNNARMTTFEFSLFKLLVEGKIRKCYFYKENPFYENEIEYLYSHYNEVWHKIELVSDVSFDSLYHTVHPTTICTYDPGFIFDHVQKETPKEEKENQCFILLNTIHTVHQDEESNNYQYYPQFLENFNQIMKEGIFVMSPMYNFQIEDETLPEEEYE